MSDDPTHWRSIARRFVSLAFDPDWLPPGRPDWPGTLPSASFRRWAGDRLPELDERVREVQRTAFSEVMEAGGWERFAEALADPEWGRLDERIAAIRRERTKAGRPPTGAEVWTQLLRWNEPKRRGPTRGADPGEAARAREAAGWDIWKLRFVILPRFWPDEAVGDYRLAGSELPKIAAERHGVSPQQALRAYREGRMASK